MKTLRLSAILASLAFLTSCAVVPPPYGGGAVYEESYGTVTSPVYSGYDYAPGYAGGTVVRSGYYSSYPYYRGYYGGRSHCCSSYPNCVHVQRVVTPVRCCSKYPNCNHHHDHDSGHDGDYHHNQPMPPTGPVKVQKPALIEGRPAPSSYRPWEYRSQDSSASPRQPVQPVKPSPAVNPMLTSGPKPPSGNASTFTSQVRAAGQASSDRKQKVEDKFREEMRKKN
jgi:hypothetical protein